MAGKRTYKKTEPTPEVAEPRKPITILKPYIDTITSDTLPRDIDVKKLPGSIKIRFKQSGTGERSNRYKGKSGTQYDFNGGVPLVITNQTDIAAFVLKARKNPETWEIVK